MSTYGAVVVGATGAVGSALLAELLASPRCAAVSALTRRPLDGLADAPGAEKLSARVVDFELLEHETAAAAKGCTLAFCALGVGQPSKVSKDELWKVDVDYLAAFARGCKSAGVQHLSLLSASGANPSSRLYYLRVKASAEQVVCAQRFGRASFFRPSLLVTRELRYGLQDRLTQATFPTISRFLPARWHEIRVEELARAMRVNAERAPSDRDAEVLHYPEFMALLEER